MAKKTKKKREPLVFRGRILPAPKAKKISRTELNALLLDIIFESCLDRGEFHSWINSDAYYRDKAEKNRVKEQEWDWLTKQ